MNIDYKAEAALLLARATNERLMIGIVGPPGAGKSTLAATLHRELEKAHPNHSVVVPMDGFHLDNETLAERELLPLKGIPDSFDAEGFVALIAHIRQASLSKTAPKIPVPIFDRTIESTIPNGLFVKPCHHIVLVEGNYLLLDKPPWHKLKVLCDEIWYLDVPEEVLTPRLNERHMAGGKSQAEAIKKIESTDLPNARLVNKSKENSTRIFSNQ